MIYLETMQAITKRSSIRTYKPEQISTQSWKKILLARNAAPLGGAIMLDYISQ